MDHIISIPGPQCVVTIIGASASDFNKTQKVLADLDRECVGELISVINAKIHSELECISGDGHNFGYHVDYVD